MNIQHLPATLLRTTLTGLVLTFAMPLAAAEDASPRAATAIAETTWNCWHARNTKILCRLADAPEVIEDAAASEVGAPTGVTTASRPARLPKIAETILQQAAKLRQRTISIPMYSHPESMANAEELADAVMCGARKSCRVQFFRSVALAALYIVGDPALD